MQPLHFVQKGCIVGGRVLQLLVGAKSCIVEINISKLVLWIRSLESNHVKYCIVLSLFILLCDLRDLIPNKWYQEPG